MTITSIHVSLPYQNKVDAIIIPFLNKLKTPTQLTATKREPFYCCLFLFCIRQLFRYSWHASQAPCNKQLHLVKDFEEFPPPLLPSPPPQLQRTFSDSWKTIPFSSCVRRTVSPVTPWEVGKARLRPFYLRKRPRRLQIFPAGAKFARVWSTSGLRSQ